VKYIDLFPKEKKIETMTKKKKQTKKKVKIIRMKKKEKYLHIGNHTYI